MTNSFFTLYAVIALFLMSWAAPAFAQSCETDYELIFDLDDPRIGSYSVWDGVHGSLEVQERYIDGLFAGGHKLVFGERYTSDAADKVFLMATLDRRGRVEHEISKPIKNLKKVVKVIEIKGGYLLIGNKVFDGGRQAGWIAFLDAAGDVLKEKTIEEPGKMITLYDVVPTHDGEGFMVAASVADMQGAKNLHSIVYRTNYDGHIMFAPAYRFGMDNEILDLQPYGKKSYIGVGHVMLPDGRKAGWVVRISENGSIDWQRQYARGAEAYLHVARPFREEQAGLIVGGVAKPSVRFGGDRAGWLMMLNAANGNIAWQRYYRGSSAYTVQDILVHEGGLLSVLLDADAPKKDEFADEPKLLQGDQSQDFVRLLTVNPRGYMMISDEYFNGLEADGYRVLPGANGERIILGQSKIKFTVQDEQAADQEKTTLQGWVVAGSGTDPYRDPCGTDFGF